jgi:hypothetical protein
LGIQSTEIYRDNFKKALESGKSTPAPQLLSAYPIASDNVLIFHREHGEAAGTRRDSPKMRHDREDERVGAVEGSDIGRIQWRIPAAATGIQADERH